MAPSVTIPDGSGPLMAARLNPGGSFPQQGQLSWVDLSKTTINMTIDVLKRFSAANIDTYTILVGQVVAGSFKLSTKGRERLEQALVNLPLMRSFGNVMWFGFGIESVVRGLATTYEGASLAALCAAAAECYPEDHAASIMWEMVLSHRPDKSFLPSGLQWKALINVCNGALSQTSFPLVLEHFMRLCELPRGLEDPTHQRICSSPDALAEALIAIGKVSTGNLESIKIHGGTDVGFLAAVAVWLLGLRIIIVRSDGKTLFENCEDTANAQVLFSIENPEEEGPSRDLDIPTKNFYLPEFSDLISVRESDMFTSQVGGRVSWDNAFGHAFGSHFKRLLGMKAAFGEALGCAARIFEAVKNAEPGFGSKVASACCSYFPSSFGIGFVSFACTNFPELSSMRSHMDKGIRGSGDDALRTYEACLVDLGRGCACVRCKDEYQHARGDEAEFCLVILVETITVMIRSLSGISIAEGLLPLITGLQASYQRQQAFHDDHDKTDIALSDGDSIEVDPLQKIHFILERQPFSGDDGVAHDLDVSRMADAARIFTRGQVDGSNLVYGHTVSAATIGGMTVLLDALLDISDDPDKIGRCHILPGRINMNERSFSWVSDLSAFKSEAYFRRHANLQDQRFRNPKDFRHDYKDLTLVASETIDFLQVAYKLTDGNDGGVILGPATYTIEFLRTSGLINCTCGPEARARASKTGHLGNSSIQHPNGGLKKVWNFTSNTKSRLVALVRCTNHVGESDFKPIIRTQECLKCCLSTCVGWDSEAILVLSKDEAGAGSTGAMMAERRRTVESPPSEAT